MKYRKEEGFTLIEIILAIAILGMLSIVLYNALYAGQRAYDFQEERINIQQVHRIIIDRISPFIREAVYIDDDPTGDNELIILFNNNLSNNDSDYAGLAYCLNSRNEFSYKKKYASTLNWSTIRNSITNVKAKNLDFIYNNGIITMNYILIGKDGQEYNFTNKFYPRYPSINTP